MEINNSKIWTGAFINYVKWISTFSLIEIHFLQITVQCTLYTLGSINHWLLWYQYMNWYACKQVYTVQCSCASACVCVRVCLFAISSQIICHVASMYYVTQKILSNDETKQQSTRARQLFLVQIDGHKILFYISNRIDIWWWYGPYIERKLLYKTRCLMGADAE